MAVLVFTANHFYVATYGVLLELLCNVTFLSRSHNNSHLELVVLEGIFSLPTFGTDNASPELVKLHNSDLKSYNEKVASHAKNHPAPKKSVQQ